MTESNKSLPRWLIRTQYVTLRVADELVFDPAQLLTGVLNIQSGASTLLLHSATDGKTLRLYQPDLEFLVATSDREWRRLDDVLKAAPLGPERIQELMDHGALDSTDSEQAPPVGEALMDGVPWDPVTRLFHLWNRGVEQKASKTAYDFEARKKINSSLVEQRIASSGDSPPARYTHPGSLERLPLGAVSRDQGLYGLLEKRKTARKFDPTVELTSEQFSVLMRYTFGESGVHRVTDGFELQYKSSPSGGSLHPLEAFPLIIGVEGFAPGFYHYNSTAHAVDLIQPIDLDAARDLAVEAAQNQEFLRNSQVLVFLVARFDRNFWKYRRRPNSYNVIYTDAGHLSQTFYLIATDLGLGPFYTGALNPQLIHDTLGIGDLKRGVLGICGCGVPAPLSKDEALLELRGR